MDHYGNWEALNETDMGSNGWWDWHTESERAEGEEMIVIITSGLIFYFAAKQTR